MGYHPARPGLMTRLKQVSIRRQPLSFTPEATNLLTTLPSLLLSPFPRGPYRLVLAALDGRGLQLLLLHLRANAPIRIHYSIPLQLRMRRCCGSELQCTLAVCSDPGDTPDTPLSLGCAPKVRCVCI